jgi:hypothetical protein
VLYGVCFIDKKPVFEFDMLKIWSIDKDDAELINLDETLDKFQLLLESSTANWIVANNSYSGRKSRSTVGKGENFRFQ